MYFCLHAASFIRNEKSTSQNYEILKNRLIHFLQILAIFSEDLRNAPKELDYVAKMCTP